MFQVRTASRQNIYRQFSSVSKIMKNITFIILLLVFVYACNTKKNDNNCDTDKINKIYSIETTTYWDNPNTDKDTIPFIVLKIDTLNYIGTSSRYTEKGKIFERIVIVDKTKALKLDYESDTIASITKCKYFLRKDHPTKDFYSIVSYK